MNPYQPQDTYEVEAATRLSRFAAALIDGLVMALPGIALAILVPMALVTRNTTALVGLLGLAALLGLTVLVAQVMLIAAHGQTLGKKALGIRMITSSGEIPSVWRVFFLRWLPFAVTGWVVQSVLKTVGSGSIIHLLDALLIFQPTRRCLHDLFADTHVIKA
jgi:uncharacterized RDD family membrane protein YckC